MWEWDFDIGLKTLQRLQLAQQTHKTWQDSAKTYLFAFAYNDCVHNQLKRHSPQWQQKSKCQKVGLHKEAYYSLSVMILALERILLKCSVMILCSFCAIIF